MTLSIKNDGYLFLMRLDLMFSLSLWREFQLLQILNDISINHLIKLILYENDVKLLKYKRSTWNEYIKENDRMVNFFSIINLMLECLLLKNFKKI